METRAVPATRDGVPGWVINGEKMWTTGMHVATHCALFARTSGEDGDARGITCFLVPANNEGVKVEEYMWTFNMPTDHPRVSFTDVFVADDALFGEVGRGLSLGAVLRPPEPHPPGRELARRGGLLHQRERQIRARAQAVRQGRWPRTRRSSGRWSSSRPRPRCCGC